MYLDYFVRALPADWPLLVHLGEKLGALRVSQPPVDENGEPIGEPTVSAAAPGAWDFLGVIHKPTGNMIETEQGEVPETAPVVDANGEAYWHANLRTTVNLGDVAQQLAESDPEVAEAMSQLGRFFLLDEAGQPRAPSAPHRVWF